MTKEESNGLPSTEDSVSGEELFRRFLEGDHDAFEDLVALYEDELSRFIYGIVEDYSEAKYLTIETFGQLAVNGKKFAGRSSLKTYLFTIGKNHATRHMKLRRKHSQHVSYDEIVEIVCNKSKTLQEHVEREEEKQMLHAAMKELKDDHRTVLRLLYFEDMSYYSAGKAMGKTEKQIKHLAYRAKAALRKKLEPERVS